MVDYGICEKHNRHNCRPCHMESEQKKYGNNTIFIEADTLKVHTEGGTLNTKWYKDKIKNRKKRKLTEKQKRK